MVVFVAVVRREPDTPPLVLIDAWPWGCAAAAVGLLVAVIRTEPDKAPLDLIDARLLGCAAAA